MQSRSVTPHTSTTNNVRRLLHQIGDPESRLVSQEQSEAQRMDVEGADGRGEMAVCPTAGAAAASPARPGAARPRVLYLHQGVLWRPAAG